MRSSAIRWWSRSKAALGGCAIPAAESESVNKTFFLKRVGVVFGMAALLGTGARGWGRVRLHRKPPPALTEIMQRLDDTARHLKTVSADLEYTKVTVVVDDKSSEFGQLYFRKGKSPEILLRFVKPDPKVILFKKNKGEIYLPKTDQIQEFDLERHSEIVQQFLMLGFGTEASELKQAYTIKLIGEEDLDGDTAAVLELVPLRQNVRAQLAKVQLWISEDSWIPIQQKFFEPGGDYLITRYRSVKVNREIPSSFFSIHAKGAKVIKMD